MNEYAIQQGWSHSAEQMYVMRRGRAIHNPQFLSRVVALHDLQH